MDTLLRVSDLGVIYRTGACSETVALTGVTLTIGAGEAVGLLGESGCGKTTTALSLLRLLPASARVVRGEVRFRARNLLDLSGNELRRIRGAEISLIFQEPSIALNPVLRIEDQVAEVIRAHKPFSRRQCLKEARDLLAQVGLSDVGGQMRAFPHELSGGQKQRVLIAQALACRPSLVIADEPTSGLDTRTQAEILTLLRELKARRRTAFLFISHNPGVLDGLADRVLVMYAGKIVEEGELGRVYRTPLHPYTRGLLGSMPPLSPEGGFRERRRPAPISGAPPDMSRLPRGCSFAPRCPARIEVCSEQEPQARKTDDGRVCCHVV